MTTHQAHAVSHPNIALIKYWGNRDEDLRLPANGSISMTLDGLETRTRVTFDPSLEADQLTLNGQPASPPASQRVAEHLGLIRQIAGLDMHALVESQSNFPAGAGLASSASAFAALTLAGCAAAGLDLPADELSRIARRGSGSAARSIFGGFVECHTGEQDMHSYAQMISPQDHWPLSDWIVLLSTQPKDVGSSEGHRLARTSPLQAARVVQAEERLQRCRQAIQLRDFDGLAAIVELDCNMMHAVMLSSSPALLYWQPETIELMRAVRGWRQAGLPVCYTVDAGPNLHCLCPAEVAQQAGERLRGAIGSVPLIHCGIGGPARIINNRIKGLKTPE